MIKLIGTHPAFNWFLLGSIIFPFLAVSQPIGQSVQLAPEEEHFLVLGSYQSYETAKNYADRLEKEGYMPSILAPSASGNSYRVSIFHSTDRYSVEAYQNQLKKAGQNAGWIHTEKFNTADFPTQSNYGPQGSPRPTYYLIAGSYSTYDLAVEEAVALQNSGFDAFVLRPPLNEVQYRVTTYYTSDRNEIEAYAAMLEKQNKRSGWILESFEDLLVRNPEELQASANTKQALTYSNVPQNQENLSNRTPAPNGQLGNNEEMFHLIGGSFESKVAAQTYMDNLKRKGFSPLLISPKQGSEKHVYRVSLFSAVDRESVKQYQDKMGADKYWILKQ